MGKQEDIKPSKVNHLPPKIPYAEIISELTAAHAAVGELKGLLTALPEPDILIAPFRKREAVASSAIEGTTATLEDVLEFQATEKEERADTDKKDPIEVERARRRYEDIVEIMNYERAIDVALKTLEQRPIGENLLKKVHSILLNSGRGADKDRGNFRRQQVRVGNYIPPVHTEIPELINNWEDYLNTDIENDYLVRIGVAHYQFEAIHPFMDGNGRIGRLVIPLFLCQVGALPTPVLYISHYVDQSKDEYRELLHNIDTKQEWIPWIKFFLTAVKEQAEMTSKIGRKIQSLYEELKQTVVPNIKSSYSMEMLDLLFKRQIITAKNVRQAISAQSKNTPYHLLDKFVEAKVLQIMNVDGREKVYVFRKLLNIINS